MNIGKNFINIIKNDKLDKVQGYSGTIWPIKYPIVEKKIKEKIDGKKLRSYFKKDEVILIFDVPFCYQKCNYCSFYGENDIYKFGSKKYVDLMIEELKTFLGKNEKKFYATVVMFQGGTPTLINDDDLLRLIEFVRQNFIIDEKTYFGTESTPNLLTRKKVKALYKAGFRRISIGVETFDEGILDRINRKQKNIMVYNAFKILREEGIFEINIDMIFGLENDFTSETFLKTNLEHILKLKPTTLDLYPLVGSTKSSNISTKDLSKRIIKTAETINSYFDRKIVITNLSIGNGKGNRNPKKNHKHFCGYDYNMALFKNVVSIGLKLYTRAFIDGKMYVFKKHGTLKDYEKNVTQKLEMYGMNFLTKEQNIKRFFIRNLFAGINLDTFEFIFGEGKENLKILLKYTYIVKKFIIIEGKYIYLKNNFQDFLPYETNDLLKDYFQMVYIYLYDNQDRKDLDDFLENRIKD